MFRRLFVAVLVAALTLAVAPRPSFGLDASPVRPRADDHLRCMYRCQERGTQKPQPKARLDKPVRPLRHCFQCGDMQRPYPYGPPNFGGRWQKFNGPVWLWTPPRRPMYDDSWDGGWGQPGWHDKADDDGWRRRPLSSQLWSRGGRSDRGHGGDRWHDPSRWSGYDAHRNHPRDRDF